jgi:hypothetical protein
MPCLLVGINFVFRSQFGAQFIDLRGSVDFEGVSASSKKLLFKIVNKADDVGTITLCLGIIHDIAAPYERSKYMVSATTGYVDLAFILILILTSDIRPNAAPSIGPVLGVVLARKAGW